MAFQFIHLEAYSRKADKGGRSTSFIFDEADRQPHASLHVENPEPPVVVYGCSIFELRTMHDQAVADARTINKDGKEKAIRIDQKTLLTAIASHPYTVDECKTDASKMAEYEVWERDTIQWLRDQYGEGLKTVIRHLDESHMHIHAYILPEHLKALELHPGVSAKRREKASALDRGEDAKTANKSGDAAYKASMRQWQDSYFDNVAMKHGLARLGPKLRRLSRGEWQREKAQAQALKKTINEAVALKWKGNDYVRNTKQKADEFITKVKAAADVVAKEKAEADVLVKQAQDRAIKINLLNESAQKQAQKASEMLRKARSDAKGILSAAEGRSRSVAGVSGLIRSFIDGFRKSRIRAKLEKEKAAEIAAINYAKNLLQGALEREKELRRDADRRASYASSSLNSVQDLREQLAKAHAQIYRLTEKSKPKSSNDFAGYEKKSGRSIRM